MPSAIGIIELSSIATGFQAQDAMLKAAQVDLAIARTICPGKYIVVVGGKVASVKSAMDAGKSVAEGFIVDDLLISNVDERVFPALTGCVVLPENYHRALGVIETFSGASIIEAADAAVKAAHVTLFRLHVAMAIGGKGFLLICGDVAAVKTAVDAGCQRIKDDGTLVNRVVVTGVTKELFQEYI
jgi:bacterial microcompartment shell protein